MGTFTKGDVIIFGSRQKGGVRGVVFLVQRFQHNRLLRQIDPKADQGHRADYRPPRRRDLGRCQLHGPDIVRAIAASNARTLTLLAQMLDRFLLLARKLSRSPGEPVRKLSRNCRKILWRLRLLYFALYENRSLPHAITHESNSGFHHNRSIAITTQPVQIIHADRSRWDTHNKGSKGHAPVQCRRSGESPHRRPT